MGGLRSITRTCRPRDDVLSSGLADNHFAAQLDQVVSRPEGYPVYGDPGAFFELTYPTEGLKRLLRSTFGRLALANVPGAEHGVIRAETSFGGGKTHALIAVYHLAKGARPGNVAEFIDPGLLPGDCQVAAVVADTLDPENGLLVNGLRTWTLWGALAAQLGEAAYTKLRASDEGRTAPGKETWAQIVGERPTIVIVDELAQHLRQLTSSGNPEVRRMADAIPAFLKNLFELAAGKRNVVVILTLASQADAYGKETTELQQVLDGLQGGFESVMADTQSLLARTGTIVKPAEDAEIAEILKRRLFAEISADAAAEAAEAYREYYEGLLARGEQLAGGADAPGTYAEQIARSYPFHPELVRVLDTRIGTIPNFQRARGALRLLAEVIAAIWERERGEANERDVTEIINVADIDYSRPAILDHMTTNLGRADFDGVARVDFAGDDAHAVTVDRTRFAGRAPYATRACRTVFTHSLELVATAGAGRADLLLGTLRVGDDPDVVTEALAEVERVAWHLFYDATRWRFLVEPNANKIVAEEMRNVPNTRVNEELAERVRRTFASDGVVKAVVFPTGPGDVDDRPQLQLVVFHHDDLSVSGTTAVPPPSRLVECLDRAGAGGSQIRMFRNGVVFLVADESTKDAMRERVRADLAAESIVNDASRLAVFSPEVQGRLRQIADTAKLEARVAITRCLKHCYFPFADKANGYLRHVELTAKAQGEAEKAQTKVVVRALEDEGKVRTAALSTDYLRQKAWPKDAAEVSTEAVVEAFWRDHGMPIVLDPTLVKDALREGVRNGSWVYFDVEAQRAWTAADSPPNVRLARDALLFTVEEAERRGLTGREPRLDDVLAVFTPPEMRGPDLRAALEARLRREPNKKEVTDVLARACDGDPPRLVVVAGAVEPGTEACTPADVRKASLDVLTILTPERAAELSIVPKRPGRTTKTVEAKGVAGVAFQSLADKASEVADVTGFTTISITASADVGEGARDLQLLGSAIGMLPKHDIHVALQAEMDFKGLSNGITVDLTGPAADYQRVEDAVLRLAGMAAAVAGTLRLDVHFAEPCPPGSPAFEQIRKVLVDLAPGELRCKGLLG